MDKDKKIPTPNVSSGTHGSSHTYAEDMAEVIEEDKGGLVKKIIHGEEQHELEKKNFSPQSQKNKFFMFVSFLLVSISIITLFIFTFRNSNPPVIVQKQFVPLIFNDQNAFFEVQGFKKDEVTQTIFHEVSSTKVKHGEVEGIYLTENKQIIGLREFFNLIQANLAFPSRDFLYDNFLSGVVNADTHDTFILMKVRSLPDVFDSMRNWEGKMFSDLHGIFGIDINAGTNYLQTKDFSDLIVANKNARVLYDKDNKIVMMYVYADDNSVLITNTAQATEEIILRLASSQIKN